MATNFQFKSSLIDYTYEGQGYSYTITPNNWTTIDVDKIIFGQFISLISDVYAGGILVLNRQKLFDKFEVTLSASSGSGGSGGGSLEPAGDWNIAESTTDGGLVESTMAFETGYDATFSGLTVSSAGAEIYPFIGPYALFSAATAQTVINDFSTTKWFTVDTPGYHLITLHDVANITNPVTDILQPIFNSALGTKKAIYIVIGAFFGDTICQVSYNGPTYSEAVALANDVVNMVGVTQIAVGINSTLGKGYIDNFVDPVYEFDLPGDIFEGVDSLQFSAGGVYGSAFGVGLTTISFPNPETKHPITQILADVIVAPPIGAADGELWNVTSTGTYDGKDLKNGDSAIFYNGLENIVAITHPDTSAIVIDAISTALDENGQIAVAIDTILAAKGFNSYGGDWNFGGQYDGSLNFSYYFSANYSNNYFTATGGNYFESEGLYYSVVRDAAADLTSQADIELILPNIVNLGTQHKLVIDIRESGAFKDTSIDDKFATFTFANLEAFGVDNTQIELSVTHSYGTEETFTFVIPDLFTVGDKIHFVLTTTGVSAFKGDGNFIGAYATNFSTTSAAIYVGYGKDSGSFYQPSFVLTQGFKDVILPPEASRENTTYRAINTDGYSTVYGKTIKDDDLVTFIGTGPSEDILVETVADLSLQAVYGPLPPVIIANGEIEQTAIRVINIENFNIVTRAVYVYTSILVDYSSGTNPSNGGVFIHFNIFGINDNSINVARNYKVGDIFQVVFNTVGGSSIEDVVFYHDPSGGNIIGSPVVIAADTTTTYTFSVMRHTNNPYNTKIVCIGKMEI